MRRSDEPIYWGLFGAGGMVVAMLLPVIVLITGLLVPMSFDRAHAFASSWWGACILLVIIALPIWHGMHRIYHGLHDLGIHTTKLHHYLMCWVVSKNVNHQSSMRPLHPCRSVRMATVSKPSVLRVRPISKRSGCSLSNSLMALTPQGASKAEGFMM